MDHHQIQLIWLHRVASVARNKAVKTIRIIGHYFRNCRRQRQLIRKTQQSISSATWVWLLYITAAISMCSTVSSGFSLHYDIQIATNQHCKATICKWWVTVDANMISTKVDMAALEWTPLHRIQYKGCHHQVHQLCLQDCRKSILSVSL